MRLLHFALITPTSPQLGLRAALRSIADQGYEEFSWYPYWQGELLPAMRQALLKRVAEFQPTLIFAQIQTPGLLPAAVLEQIRSMVNCRIVSWCGDLRDETPEWAWKVAPHVLHCFSNERDVENLRAKGFPAEFLNIGFSTDIFTPDGPKRMGTPEIVFMGTNYAGRFPRSAQRQQIVATLRQRYGSRFAVYGHGWGSGDVFLGEAEEAAAYRTCKIALDINHYDSVPRFTSDRRFRAMGSGAFVLANWHPGIERDFDCRPHLDAHLVTWKVPGEIPGLIDSWLADDMARASIAAAGCRHAHENHSWLARMAELKQILERHAA